MLQTCLWMWGIYPDPTTWLRYVTTSAATLCTRDRIFEREIATDAGTRRRHEQFVLRMYITGLNIPLW